MTCPGPLVLGKSLLKFSVLWVDQMSFGPPHIYPERRVLAASSQSE